MMLIWNNLFLSGMDSEGSIGLPSHGEIWEIVEAEMEDAIATH